MGQEPWSSGYGHVQEVVGSNPSVTYWMDIFHIVIKIGLFVWEGLK